MLTPRAEAVCATMGDGKLTHDDSARRVGARVLILSNRATVRYLGPVSGQDGQWVGVEYDDPTRGKHDGIAGGVRYFTTVGGPHAGSFVRLEKVDWGRSVLHALVARYNNQRSELGGAEATAEELYVRTASNRRVHIQVLGVEKIQAQQSQTHRLASARLVGAGVSEVGDPAALSAAGSSLVELDLTCNLISSWEGFVPGLLAALPKLQVLNLSDNLLALPMQDAFPSPPLLGLRALVLNDCRLTWTEVVRLARSLPNLQELHLSGNGIRSLSPTSSSKTNSGTETHALGSLQVLCLDDNSLESWQEVQACLGHLPSLRVLNLSSNPLNGLVAGAAAALEPFRDLEVLYLANCQLATWADIDVLNRMPKLHDTRLTGNPVFNTAKGGGRFEVLGRVAGLTMLNGAAVSARERRDAEIRYLQNIISGPMKHLSSTPDHGRLSELKAKFGDVLGTAVNTGQHGSLADTMLHLKLTCVAAASKAKMGSHDKKLPRSMQLQALQVLCDKLFKVAIPDQVLYMKAPDDPIPQDLLHHGGALSLAELGLQDGCEVLVDQRE